MGFALVSVVVKVEEADLRLYSLQQLTFVLVQAQVVDSGSQRSSACFQGAVAAFLAKVGGLLRRPVSGADLGVRLEGPVTQCQLKEARAPHIARADPLHVLSSIAAGVSTQLSAPPVQDGADLSRPDSGRLHMWVDILPLDDPDLPKP